MAYFSSYSYGYFIKSLFFFNRLMQIYFAPKHHRECSTNPIQTLGNYLVPLSKCLNADLNIVLCMGTFERGSIGHTDGTTRAYVPVARAKL